MIPATYILPIRRSVPAQSELARYLDWLYSRLDVVVVDGSAPHVFAVHHRKWPSGVVHIPPDRHTPNGKVGGVLTGVRAARHERLVIADDDVRWTEEALRRTVDLLEQADVVRPQNYFRPLPWHARWDSARSLLNRVSGGDWPGTFGVRRSALVGTGGYRGDVLFENLEMVRTIQAGGGTVTTPLDLYVRRLPPTFRHFLGQRVRQAYDEFARPGRMVLSLALLPGVLLLAASRHRAVIAWLCGFTVAAAELGRRRAGGRDYFPPSTSLLAPLWLLERGTCSWLAVYALLRHGGIRYGEGVLRDAASPLRSLRRTRSGPAAGTSASTVLEGVR